MTKQRPKYQRAASSPPMRFQRRDGEILQTIYDFDGVVAKRQLKTMFWPDATQRAMEKRLSLLYHNGYINWPGKQQWQANPVPEPVCWLGWKGILWIAGQHGVAAVPPKKIGENQLRQLERTLRREGIRWVREPRWSQLTHDLAIVDVRIRIIQAVSEVPNLTLEEWVPESAFSTNMDVVEYIVEDRNGHPRKRKRGVCPDGYFVIRDELRAARGQPARARFLLEVDNGTHDVPSFGREKILPGVAYLKSSEYYYRFSTRSGCWLVVARGGEKRLHNLMRRTEQMNSSDANLFLFTMLAQFESANPLTDTIWLQAGREGDYPVAISLLD